MLGSRYAHLGVFSPFHLFYNYENGVPSGLTGRDSVINNNVVESQCYHPTKINKLGCLHLERRSDDREGLLHINACITALNGYRRADIVCRNIPGMTGYAFLTAGAVLTVPRYVAEETLTAGENLQVYPGTPFCQVKEGLSLLTFDLPFFASNF